MGSSPPEADVKSGASPDSAKQKFEGGQSEETTSETSSTSIKDILSQAEEAAKHLGSEKDGNVFSSALGFLNQLHSQNKLGAGELNEKELRSTHETAYDDSKAAFGASGLGIAAAITALKSFMLMIGTSFATGGGAPASLLVGMAMAEAAKLFDKKASNTGTQIEGTKQDAVNNAASMAMKMLSKGDSESGTGGFLRNISGAKSLLSTAGAGAISELVKSTGAPGGIANMLSTAVSSDTSGGHGLGDAIKFAKNNAGLIGNVMNMTSQPKANAGLGDLLNIAKQFM